MYYTYLVKSGLDVSIGVLLLVLKNVATDSL